MTQKGQIIVKISNIGNSIGFIIDKKTVKYLNLEKDELVQLKIVKNDITGEDISKITTIGKSLGVIVDKKTADFLKLEVDDLVQVSIIRQIQ